MIPAERIETLRAELPPPIKPGERGRKTHGRWIGLDSKARPIVSGRDDDALLAEQQLERLGMPGRTTRAADVEMKLAAYMVQHEIKHVTVVINHRPGKGDYGCDTLVPILLPKGYTLTVHGVTRQGTRYYKRYTGGAKPWWR